MRGVPPDITHGGQLAPPAASGRAPRRGRISTKMILASSLLIVLTVVGFGVLNVVNTRAVYDEVTRDRIATFRASLALRGATTTQVFAQALLPLLQNNQDPEIATLLGEAARQDPELTVAYVLGRDHAVISYCPVQGDRGRTCAPSPYAARAAMTHASWDRARAIWAERQRRDDSRTLVDVEIVDGDRRIEFFVYPVFSSAAAASPAAALALGDGGGTRWGYVALGYDLAPIDQFVARSEVQKKSASFNAALRTGAVGALMALIGTVLAIFQGLSMSRPIKMLGWKANQIASGDLEARVDVTSNDEIGLLADNFNYMADQIAILLQHAAEKATLEKELQVARAIQETLVPSTDPIARGDLRLAGYFQPASQCGGDWWSYQDLAGGKLLVLIGDVTGHGVPSAMMTATARASCDVACHMLDDGVTASRLLEIMNNALWKSSRRKFVMTCFAVIFDPVECTMTFANAGHNFPYLYKSSRGEFGALIARGNSLGYEETTRFTSRMTRLELGDVVVMFTDGLIECESPSGEEYGDKRLRAAISRAAHLDAGPLRDAIVADALAFYGGRPPRDDITLVVGRIGPPPEVS